MKKAIEGKRKEKQKKKKTEALIWDEMNVKKIGLSPAGN